MLYYIPWIISPWRGGYNLWRKWRFALNFLPWIKKIDLISSDRLQLCNWGIARAARVDWKLASKLRYASQQQLSCHHILYYNSFVTIVFDNRELWWQFLLLLPLFSLHSCIVHFFNPVRILSSRHKSLEQTRWIETFPYKIGFVYFEIREIREGKTRESTNHRVASADSFVCRHTSYS